MHETYQPNYTDDKKVDKATVSDWRVLQHLSTGLWMFEVKGNDDSGIDKLKETSDGKEDSNNQTLHGLRALSCNEL